MDSCRYLQLDGLMVGTWCSRRWLLSEEGKCRSQARPSELAALQSSACATASTEGSGGQIVVLLGSMKSPWACAGVMGWKLVK